MTGPATRLRILVVGDSYCPSAVIRDAFNRIAPPHEVSFLDVRDDPGWGPSSTSERRIREYMGTPAQVIEALRGHDVLVVQAAPVTDAVLDSDPTLRLVCCARGGPVNIDVAAATARGIAVTTTPGKNADAVAELTIAFLVMLARRLREVLRHVDAGGEFGHDNYEGAKLVRSRSRRPCARDRRLRPDRAAGSPAAPRRSACACSLTTRSSSLTRYAPVEPSRSICRRSCKGPTSSRCTRGRRSDNRGLIGTHEIAAMRPGAYLVNTSRDSADRRAGCPRRARVGPPCRRRARRLSPSPASGRHPLLEHPNAIVTAHIGGATFETLLHGGEMAVEEIERFAAGEPLRNVADRSVLSLGTATGSPR